MKLIKFIAPAVILIVVLFSCNKSPFQPPSDKTGSLVVIIPEISAKGEVSLPSGAQEATNIYGIYLINDDTEIGYAVTSGGEYQFNDIPIGKYNLLVMAGFKAEGSFEVWLLGVGEEKEVEIEADDPAEETITLSAIDFSFTLSAGSVLIGSEFTVSTAGDYKHAMITIGSEFFEVAFDGGTYPFTSYDQKKQKSAWEAEVNITAPGTASEGKEVEFVGKKLKYFPDPKDTITKEDFPATDEGAFEWYWPSYAYAGTDFVLPEAIKTIDVVETPPTPRGELGLTIEWEQYDD